EANAILRIEVRVAVAVHKLGPARRLVVHHVRVRQVRDDEQRDRGPLPAGGQADTSQLRAERVLLAVGGGQRPVAAGAGLARSQPPLRRVDRCRVGHRYCLFLIGVTTGELAGNSDIRIDLRGQNRTLLSGRDTGLPERLGGAGSSGPVRPADMCSWLSRHAVFTWADARHLRASLKSVTALDT